MRKVFARLTVVVGLMPAVAGASFAGDAPEFPKEQQRFLAELSILMMKYPKAAERFSLRDSSSAAKLSSSHRACCEWSCPWHPPGSAPPRECKCNMQCLE